MNAYDILGIEPRLVIGDEVLRIAFQEAGKLAHPDAGGTQESFEKLREAMDALASPSRRLRLWMESRGLTIDPRGVLDSGVMDLFSSVGEVIQRAEGLVRRRDEAKSALGRALLESETQACREEVESALSRIGAAIADITASFPRYENEASASIEEMSAGYRNLAFLEKWRLTLRGLFSRLV